MTKRNLYFFFYVIIIKGDVMKKDKDNKKKKKTSSSVKKDYLFKTSTIIDMYEFKKFQKFYLNKFKSSIIPIIIMALLAIVAIVLNFIKGNYSVVGLVIVFIIVYPIILSFTLSSQIKKMYKSNKRINMLEETLTFYDEFLESKSDHNYCKVQYTDIYRVCETKSNFYIFISDNQAFIIIKSELKDVDGFKDFIIDKAPYKKYR